MTFSEEWLAMPEQPALDPQTLSQVQVGLHELTGLLRSGQRLDPEQQHELAKLVDELTQALVPGALSAAEVAILAEDVSHLTHALRHRQDATLLSRAKERLEASTLRAEVKTPIATDIARRLLEALANLGI
jgi:hypothetical protein